MSTTGSLIYVPATGAQGRSLVWVDRQGQEEPVGAEPGEYTGLRLSPDGGRAVVVMRAADGNEDVLIYDLARDIATRLTFHAARDSFPVWSPDGERVAFASERDGGMNVFWKTTDGTGEAERLTTPTAGRRTLPSSWAPDGTLVLVEAPSGGQLDIAVLSLDAERALETLIATEFNEPYPEVSPDGRWLAHVSNESGQSEVYIRPFPNVQAGRWQVSQDGGSWPVWAPDGRELFYRRTPDFAMMVAPVETEPTFRPRTPVVLFDAPNLLPAAGPRAFDVAPDGQRFLMIKTGDATSEDARPQINIVENWHQELLERVPIP